MISMHYHSKKIILKKVACLFLFIACLGLNQTFGQKIADNDRILGEWEVGSGKARIKISKYGDKYSGKLVWLKEPLYADGTAKRDKKNPDAGKQNVPLLGYTNLLGFVYKGKNTWAEGTIYDPENGNTYNCVLKLMNESTLDVSGFIGVQLLGRTETWKLCK